MDERSDAAALAGALRLTDLPSLVDAVVVQAYDGVQNLAGSLPGQRDEERYANHKLLVFWEGVQM